MLHLAGQTFNCAKCRKELTFKTETAYTLICPDCRFINMRLALSATSGTEAEPVLEDMSLIRIGTKGIYQGKPFEVIGRIQYLFQDSYRNHWYIAFNTQDTAWLGEWACNYSVFTALNSPPPEKFRKLSAGKGIEFNNNRYEAELLDKQWATFAEGEIPKYVNTEKQFLTVFFTNVLGAMALANVFKKEGSNTIDLELFGGNYVSLTDLNLQHLRLHDDWRCA